MNMIEIKDGGWDALKESLATSRGKALILVHPMFRMAGGDSFDAYANKLVPLVSAAEKAALTVIACIDADLKENTSLVRERAVSNFKDKFISYGYHQQGEIYGYVTIPWDSSPLEYCHMSQWRASALFAQQLKASGLRSAWFAGAYLGGYQEFGPEYVPGYKEDEDLLVMAARGTGGRVQHIMNVIGGRLQGCVPGAMRDLVAVGVNCYVTRVTYPQKIPIMSELAFKGETIIWKPGKPMISWE